MSESVVRFADCEPWQRPIEKIRYLILDLSFMVESFLHKFPEKFCGHLKVPGRGGIGLAGPGGGRGVDLEAM
jgi:hypothetical protein